MTDEIAKTSEADEAVMRSIADAMRDAAATASDHAVQLKQAASEAGPKALETVSQIFYTSSDVLAYHRLCDGLRCPIASPGESDHPRVA